MIAYSPASLDYGALRAQLDEAVWRGCISAGEREVCLKKYKADFYTPKLPIGIGLFVMTLVIAAACVALIFQFFEFSWVDNFYIFLFMGIAAYGLLEYLVGVKKHVRSGVDDALVWITALLLIAAIRYTHWQATGQTGLSLVLLAYLTLRFANSVMAAACLVVFLYLLLLVILPSGYWSFGGTPFIISGVALSGYLLAALFTDSPRLNHYRNCLLAFELASLSAAYYLINYFIIQEVPNPLRYQPEPAKAWAWFSWILTFCMPLAFLGAGLKKKRLMLIRLGILGLAFAVLTLRHFHPLLPAEQAMVLWGLVLLGLPWWLMKYLFRVRHGFIYQPKDMDPARQAGALVATAAFSMATPGPEGHTSFGGGSGGGGGAGSSF